ncbi:AAA family ATPase [Flavobacterium phycosphaerae]|uniref:AAA family ATPase n=1 Tax=Flavobacterium phycosphaerae TaxID=2697515 RepID=UPI00138B184C|nr:AAA family ATPase [Flavobacterium phycosphaerae]
MKIKKLYINNFRILENFVIDLEDEISLIIGKNNSGKTSILTILDKFLNQPESSRFSIEDFNLNFVTSITNLIEDSLELKEEDFVKNFYGIKLRILFEYFDHDNFSKVQKLMLDLDPENNFIVLGFDYYLNYENYLKIRDDYKAFKNRETGKKNQAASSSPPKKYIEKTFKNFIKLNFQDYFTNKKNLFSTIKVLMK